MLSLRAPSSSSASSSSSSSLHMAKFARALLGACRTPAMAGGAGSIELILGPMFSGKSETLIQVSAGIRASGARVALVKSIVDSRYGTPCRKEGSAVIDSEIVTHSGQRQPCFAAASLRDFQESFSPAEWDKIHVVGIDEGQFFKDLFSFCTAAADAGGKRVVVAGLSGDFLRSPFGDVLDLIPHADAVTMLKAKCDICGKDAIFSKRTVANRDQQLVGGADMYRPVCREHYLEPTGAP